ncbi:MAG: DUF3822 family protein, partial [Schleiferiaceae bacterium]|nr:DUF3822 family protein [Schleiferiaceae bacterium]
IGLGDYSSPQHNPHHLTEILEQFTGDFGSVSLAFDTHPSQILPEALFSSSHVGDYHQLLHSAIPENLHTDRLSDWDLVVAHEVDSDLERDFKKHFPNIVVRHAHSFLIDYFLSKHKKDEGSIVVVDKTEGNIHVLGLQNGSVQLCNRFATQTPEDFAYYVMLVIDQMKCSATDFKLVLLGKRAHYSKEEPLMQRYVKSISFFERPSHHKYSPEFSKALEAGYHQLYIQYACVS